MSMRGRDGEVRSLSDTPFGYTMQIISGKWKMVILYILSERQPVRFNEMQKFIGNITYKTLSLQLKELEKDGIVERKEYPQIPPKVEYYLTERGMSLIPILNESWAAGAWTTRTMTGIPERQKKMCRWHIFFLFFYPSRCASPQSFSSSRMGIRLSALEVSEYSTRTGISSN